MMTTMIHVTGKMRTETLRAQHEAHLKEVVSMHAVGEIAGWLERADPPRSGRASS